MTSNKICERISSIKEGYKGIEVSIGERNCYDNWEIQLRYFMYQYERYLAIQAHHSISEEVWEKIWNCSPSTTIEHICPKSCYGSQWSSKNFNSDNVNFLGNLILLPPEENSRCGTKPFNDKKKIYESSGLKLVREILECDEWNLESMKKRETKLINFANTYWLK